MKNMSKLLVHIPVYCNNNNIKKSSGIILYVQLIGRNLRTKDLRSSFFSSLFISPFSWLSGIICPKLLTSVNSAIPRTVRNSVFFYNIR